MRHLCRTPGAISSSTPSAPSPTVVVPPVPTTLKGHTSAARPCFGPTRSAPLWPFMFAQTCIRSSLPAFVCVTCLTPAACITSATSLSFIPYTHTCRTPYLLPFTIRCCRLRPAAWPAAGHGSRHVRWRRQGHVGRGQGGARPADVGRRRRHWRLPHLMCG